MGRKRDGDQNDLPQYMYRGDQNDWLIIPSKGIGKKTRYKSEPLARATAARVIELVTQLREARLMEAGRPTIAGLVDKWIRDQLQFMGWKAGTRTNNLAKIKRIKRELGERTLASTDSPFLTDWLASFCHTADTFNKWRYALVILFDFAVSRKLLAVNEAANVMERSMSLNLEANQKVRHPLDIEGFKAIQTFAAPWLTLAMDLALVTLQGRNEIVNMMHADFRDGFIYVIREKVSNQSDAAFIRIRVTEDIRELRSRALRLDNLASPYLIHYDPVEAHRRAACGQTPLDVRDARLPHKSIC